MFNSIHCLFILYWLGSSRLVARINYPSNTINTKVKGIKKLRAERLCGWTTLLLFTYLGIILFDSHTGNSTIMYNGSYTPVVFIHI